MVECGLRTELAGFLVEADDLNFVVVLLDEAAQRQSEAFVGSHAPVHGVQRIRRDVLVDLFALAAGSRHDVRLRFRLNDEVVGDSEDRKRAFCQSGSKNKIKQIGTSVSLFRWVYLE